MLPQKVTKAQYHNFKLKSPIFIQTKDFLLNLHIFVKYDTQYIALICETITKRILLIVTIVTFPETAI